jgi:hypothetical protein
VSHVYNPVATALTTITCPDDGDPNGAASVNLPLKKLADAVAEAMLRVSPLVRVAPFRPQLIMRDATEFRSVWSAAKQMYPIDGWNSTGATHGDGASGGLTMSINGIYEVQEVNSASTLTWPMAMRLGPDMIAHGRTLSEVRVGFKGASGHAALPVGMPCLTVVRSGWDGVSGTVSLWNAGTNGWTQDYVLSVANYQIAHHLPTFTANQNNVIDHEQYVYDLLVQYECGTNALANGTFYGVKCTCV